MTNPKVGDVVRVKGAPGRGTAVIEALYSDIPGGVILDAPLNRFYSWNMADLIRVRHAPKGRKWKCG